MQQVSANARVTKVDAQNATAQSLIGSANRATVTVYYDAAAILYLLVGAGTPSATNYTAKLGTGFLTYWESPDNYRGALQGFFSAATGSALVTELY